MKRRLSQAALAGLLSWGALAAATPAMACVPASIEVVLEFAPGSADIDEVDRAELEEFVRRQPTGFGWTVAARAFADVEGAIEAESWRAEDVALARSRLDAISNGLMMMGGHPVLDRQEVGVAPAGPAPRRPGADGVERHGRAVVFIRWDRPAPRPDDGRPVPVC